MKQLDALRAFAVFGVLYHHMVDWRTKPLLLFKNSINWGAMGVDLFYVLSGFLITSILLSSKNEIDAGKENLPNCIRKFLIRRVLRIFPIYYLTLLVAFLLNVPIVRETIWWHVSYASNFYMAKIGNWGAGCLNHLWSLSVEEQFYLIWPWIILLVPKKRLLGVLILTVAIGPLFRHICDIFHTNHLVPLVVTLGNMDLFGIGAILAYLKTYGVVNNDKSALYLRLCLIIGGSLFLESLLLRSLGLSNSLQNFNRTYEGLFFGWIINKASDGFSGFVGTILEFRPLTYLGKISYGIYLYHNFVPDISTTVLNMLNITATTSISISFFIRVTVTIIMASISWHLIERPIYILRTKIEASNYLKSKPVCNVQVD
jgi:peptidoglycan/LPS O-acetylase OafA/YrhL